MSDPSASEFESYAQSARYYDAIYAATGKDYAKESQQIDALIGQHKRSPGNTLLDVACGTGKHLQYLKAKYAVEGLDIDSQMLQAARAQQPDVKFQQGDMLDFKLGRYFDAIICLFSAIGYTKTISNLTRAIQTMTNHLEPGGVLIVEPWIMPEGFFDGHLSANFVNEPDLKLARMSISRDENGVSIVDFHYMVGTPQGIEFFTEHHALGLFTADQYLAAFTGAGLEATFDPKGLTGRGLYVAIRNR